MIRKISVSLYLLSPLSHGAFSDIDMGNFSPIRREPIVSLQGHPRVPVVSGNALRGVLRRSLMRELLAACGISREGMIEALPSKGRRAWDRLYAALANGGTVESAETHIDPGAARELRKSLPPLSLLGGALYSSMIPGMARIGLCWPVCEETIAGGVARAPSGYPVAKAADLISDYGQVRHVDKTIADSEASKVTPMPYTVETLSAGVILQSSCYLDNQATEVEGSCLAHGLSLLTHIGGKGASGLGAVRVEVEGAGPEAYREWIKENKESSRAALLSLAERMV